MHRIKIIDHQVKNILNKNKVGLLLELFEGKQFKAVYIILLLQFTYHK